MTNNNGFFEQLGEILKPEPELLQHLQGKAIRAHNWTSFSPEKRGEQMIKLIKAAMSRIHPDDLLELMYDQCCNSTQREYLRDKMIDLAVLKGGIFIKVESMQQKDKIEEFTKSEIFPFFNEQQTNIFSY